jgi:hypothetical protein
MMEGPGSSYMPLTDYDRQALAVYVACLPAI